jgi:hypothetical protein
MEGKLINNPADIFFYMHSYMQRWRVLVRPKDRATLDVVMEGVRRLQTTTRAQAGGSQRSS